MKYDSENFSDTLKVNRNCFFLKQMVVRPKHVTDNLNKIVNNIYCILASCYIRLTLNICSFVRQCNTFTS
jgi:hypothetical protein